MKISTEQKSLPAKLVVDVIAVIVLGLIARAAGDAPGAHVDILPTRS